MLIDYMNLRKLLLVNLNFNEIIICNCYLNIIVVR